MQKLKNRLIITGIKKSIYNILILTIISLGIVSCKNSSQKRENNFYRIDLAVKYKKEVNSFMIDTNGVALVIFKEVDMPDKYYKITFNSTEINYIQKSLHEIDFSTCDTINENVMDGVQYVFYLSDKNTKREIINGTCEQQKPLDKLVNFIVETYRKKQKEVLFNGLNTITPPGLPNINDSVN
ncbi:MAG: hypothetical protein M0D53_04280 [Flavobacterium sp. JAD_PAG50586_2]|nr:MAG: hypothetical protein M0D53_04280 [Flavobacterium sp. JAD_PAG50586_2]